jgi:hypothetical protein
MCIKPLLLNHMLKDIIRIYKESLEEVTGRPIGLVSTGKGMFSEEIKSNSCKWVRWMRYVLTRGAMIAGKCKTYLWVPLWKASCTCPGCKCFQAHSFLLYLFLYCFFFQEANQGTLPWHGDQWWQCYPQALSRK